MSTTIRVSTEQRDRRRRLAEEHQILDILAMITGSPDQASLKRVINPITERFCKHQNREQSFGVLVASTPERGADLSFFPNEKLEVR